MDPLELLRGRNHHDLELPSGLWYTLRLPRIEECMAAGGVPMSLLFRVVADQLARHPKAGVSEAGEKQDEITPEEFTPEELQRMARYKNDLVRRAVTRVAETEEELKQLEETEFTIEGVRDIPEEDWQMLVLYAGRDMPIPKAGESTPKASPRSSRRKKGSSSPPPSGSGGETPPLESQTT